MDLILLILQEYSLLLRLDTADTSEYSALSAVKTVHAGYTPCILGLTPPIIGACSVCSGLGTADTRQVLLALERVNAGQYPSIIGYCERVLQYTRHCLRRKNAFDPLERRLVQLSSCTIDSEESLATLKSFGKYSCSAQLQRNRSDGSSTRSTVMSTCPRNIIHLPDVWGPMLW